MKNRFGVFVCLLLLAPVAFAQYNRLGGGFEAQLAQMGPSETAVAVVTFDGDGPATSEQLGALRSVGLTEGLTFRALPVVGIVGTADQIRAVAALPGVRSVYPNKQLTYYNFDARHMTGVEKLRTDSRLRNGQGLPYSGKGVTVVVHDSGIDGTHPDLKYGTNVIQNVQGLLNPAGTVSAFISGLERFTPAVYSEGHPNTDISSGHGTHVAGSVGGTGQQSAGKHAGMAPGASLVGYGSGAVLLILDAIGGFDYAIVNQFRYGIRVITNSWGGGGPFDGNDPVNVASYAAYQRGITVLFAAGNEGPGEDTHNPYAVAPWVISVGAGEKIGRLAGFSSRGVRGQSGTVTTADGETHTWVNEPTVVAPGVNIISTRTNTGALPQLEAEADVAELGANAAFYTHMSGTSMATPVVAGIVALLLEANPQLQPDDVKRILKATATNMPGYESWEVGAGYVNAYNAIVSALGRRTDFGSTLTATGTYNANAVLLPGGTQPFSIYFTPYGAREEKSFEVGPNVAMVTARATVPANTVGIQLIDPTGKRYGSSIALPLLGSTVAVSAPAIPGTWKVRVSGIGSVSGVSVDPLKLTNGLAAPGTVNGTIKFVLSGGYTGVDDIAGHPARGAIEAGISNRLVDGLKNGKFKPDQNLTRAELAQYAVWGFGARQSLPLAGGFTFGDVSATLAPYVEAATARGGALRDRFQTTRGLVRATGSTFSPNGTVNRAELSYTLGQTLGLQAIAEALNADFAAGRKSMWVEFNNQQVTLTDAGSIPADLKGYVQLALDLGLLNARFALTQGPYDLQPTITASFGPSDLVKRGDYAVAASATMNAFLLGDVAAAYSAGNTTSTISAPGQVSAATSTASAATLTFEAPYPNPVRASATLRFSLPEATRVRLAIYDAMGREVARLADGEQAAGAHTVLLDARTLAAGTYVSRLEAGGRVQTQRLVVVR
jgi:serine protease AprX